MAGEDTSCRDDSRSVDMAVSARHGKQPIWLISYEGKPAGYLNPIVERVERRDPCTLFGLFEWRCLVISVGEAGQYST